MLKHSSKQEIKKMLYLKQGRRCAACGRKMEKNKLQIHHITPRVYNGQNSTENLILLCEECHNQLHKFINWKILELIEKHCGAKNFFQSVTKEFIQKKSSKNNFTRFEPLTETIVTAMKDPKTQTTKKKQPPVKKRNTPWGNGRGFR